MAEVVEEQQELTTDEQWREAIAKAEQPEEPSAKTEEGEEESESDETDEKQSESDEDGPKSERAAIQENKRLRQLNRETREQLEELQRKVEALSQPKDEPNKKEDRLKTASVEELLDAEVTIERKLLEAYQSGDNELVTQLSDAKKKIKTELYSRPNKEAKSETKKEKAVSQFRALADEVSRDYPELGDKSSDLYKKASKYYADNPELMEQLGELGQYFAVLTTLAKRPAKGKVEKQEQKDVVKEMEKIVENTTSRSPNSRSSKETGAISVSTLSDKDFEVLWDEMKMGKVKVAQLGK